MPNDTVGAYPSIPAQITLVANTAKSDIYPPAGTAEIWVRTALTDVKINVGGAASATSPAVLSSHDSFPFRGSSMTATWNGAASGGYISLFSATGGVVNLIYIIK